MYGLTPQQKEEIEGDNKDIAPNSGAVVWRFIGLEGPGPDIYVLQQLS